MRGGRRGCGGVSVPACACVCEQLSGCGCECERLSGCERECDESGR